MPISAQAGLALASVVNLTDNKLYRMPNLNDCICRLRCFLRYSFLLALLFLDCQGKDPDPAPVAEVRSNFAAIVVKNVDNASAWYRALLNLTVKSQQNDPGGSYKIVILTSSDFQMELLELSGSISRESVLTGKPAGTQIQGWFKIGFEVARMDEWMSHVQALQISIPQVYTDASGKRNFLITDPDGNLVQFFEK